MFSRNESLYVSENVILSSSTRCLKVLILNLESIHETHS